jgi:hypothetical protein
MRARAQRQQNNIVAILFDGLWVIRSLKIAITLFIISSIYFPEAQSMPSLFLREHECLNR